MLIEKTPLLQTDGARGFVVCDSDEKKGQGIRAKPDISQRNQTSPEDGDSSIR